MRYKIMYTIIVFILSFMMSMDSYSQNDFFGSWIIPTSDLNTWDQVNEPEVSLEKSYNLIFTNQGLSSFTAVSDYLNSVRKPPFSAGAYLENGELDFYIIGHRLYFQGEEYPWLNTNSSRHLKSDFTIIPSMNSTGHSYKCIFSYHQEEKDSFTTLYEANIITTSNSIDYEVNFIENGGNRKSPDNLAHAVSKVFEYEAVRIIYYCVETKGLYAITLDEDGGTSSTETILDSDSDFAAFTLELKDNDDFDADPTLAWITDPGNNSEPGENSNIYLFYDDDAEVISPELGIIAGLEFSKKDDHILYISTQDNGIVAIDYISSIEDEELVIDQTLTPTVNDDFTHTYLQTAPDGNIYAVSDDGYRLGQISMDPNGNGEFFANYFEFPDAELTGGVGTYEFFEIDNEYVRYYTLPDNENAFYSLCGCTPGGSTGVLCHACDATVDIHIHGGIADYSLEIENEDGVDYIDNYTYDDDNHIFYGTELCEGTYYFTVTDSDTPPQSYSSTFTVENWNTYDFTEDMLIIDQNDPTPHPSLSDLTWDASDEFMEEGLIMFEKGFTLINNTTLTVNNLNLEFDINAKVIIEEGSKLILNSSVLTNYHCETEYMWSGVEVWGKKNLKQTTVNQGKLEMHNSTIEFAHEAVQLWNPEDINSSGGIIFAENSYFYNNHRALVFMQYISTNNFGYEIDYAANFNMCTFENNQNYLPDNPFMTFVTMWKVRGVDFYACDFINSPAFPDSKAIYTLDAGYKFRGYCDGASGPNGCLPDDWETNSFTGFLKAIESSNTFFDSDQYAINIFDSEFDNNQYGVFMTTVNNAATILNNEFIIGDNGYANFEKGECGYFSARGIQMNGSFGFAIEENKFNKANSTNSGDIVGVLVNECPSTADDIYKNNFNDLTVGNQAEKVNRYDVDDDKLGVSYMCNINQGNSIDFFITEDESRIRHNVGYDSLASGNVLSNTDMQFRNDFTEIVEFYYYDSPDAPNEKLEYYTPYYVQSKPTTNQNACLSHFGGGTGEDPKLVLSDDEKIVTEQVFYLNHQDYESVSNLLEELKDGGSTETTNLTIAAAQPSDTWELRANLLGMSPYLSKEVLMEASDKTNVLPESVIFEILSANPDELQKADLLDYLENKAQPLPDYMIAILRQMSNGVSAKTAMLSQKAYYFSKKNIAAQSMIRSIKNEDELDISALRNWLGNVGSFENDKQVVSTYLYEGNYTAANNLLNLIPDLYNLEGESLEEFNDYKDLLNLQITLQQDDRNIFMLNDSEKSQLLVLAEYSQGDAKYGARNILSFVYGDNYCDCISPVSGGNKSTISSQVYTQDDIAHAMGLSVSVKPNPANIYASFDYTLPIGVEQATLQIINVEGEIVYSCLVNGTQGQISLDVRNYKSGAYIYKILAGDFSISESLIIQ